MATHSSSSLLVKSADQGWGTVLAREIDASIETLSRDRDVISVAVTPLVHSQRVSGFGTDAFDTYTAGVIVTVIWQELAG
jgi:hypothetical protein